MTTRSLLCAPLLFLLSVGLILGCGPKKSVPAEVSGTVTYNGAPVTGGTLLFYSNEGLYSAVIAADGTYSAVDLPMGEMTVTVDNERLNPDAKTPTYDTKTAAAGGGAISKSGKSGSGSPPPGGGAPKSVKGGKQESSPVPEGATTTTDQRYVKIPKIYKEKDKSPLKATLQAGKQVVNFELKD